MFITTLKCTFLGRGVSPPANNGASTAFGVRAYAATSSGGGLSATSAGGAVATGTAAAVGCAAGFGGVAAGGTLTGGFFVGGVQVPNKIL